MYWIEPMVMKKNITVHDDDDATMFNKFIES